MQLLAKVCLFTIAASLPLERRKDFYTTHEEHGHLPGPRNPSPKDYFTQMGRIMTGENPFKVFNTLNEQADEKKGVRFNRPSEKNGRTRYMEAIGLSDLPVIGKY
ncbi:hypothetical protein DSO57_1026552 [Entomophthora muscae]|uniref:Uncharacterized protein n=2 Tax=Entomophthora muscae TaxID=34485 RepID=A0ACC2SRD4_9FUNG|nr:hypothetical protein DSO57_1022874 [Entomophthora muscae]KAJ9064796.1 hypothetical protein DSO57_1026552 [Entomophthora muscae]